MVAPAHVMTQDPQAQGRSPHAPVLLRETLDLLAPRPGALVVDATLGPGGHAAALLERVGALGRVVGIDRDPATLRLARERLAAAADRLVTVHGDHRDLDALLAGLGIEQVDGVLADLGISSFQLDDPGRGFSFSADGPLDMRMDPTGGAPTAADLLARLPEREIATLLWTLGEERLSRRIARAIVARRTRAPLARTGELARLVEEVAGPRARADRIHPATRTFQALRIAVNGEIEGLDRFVRAAAARLRPGGRLAVISFHSLEDRAIKSALRALEPRCTCPPGLPRCGCGRPGILRVLTPRPVRPSDAETAANPRARSARLRAAERIP